MATAKGSIRVYDLAREVKQDTKRVMEDLRREGADVSVPSNTVSHDLAEKVRSRYFPKVEVAPKRGIKVIKAAAKKVDEPVVEAEERPIVAEAPVEETPTETVPEVPEVPAVEPPEAPETTTQVRKLAKKAVAKPAVVEEAPAAPKRVVAKPKTATPEPVPIAEAEIPAAAEVAEPEVQDVAAPRTGTTVKTL